MAKQVDGYAANVKWVAAKQRELMQRLETETDPKRRRKIEKMLDRIDAQDRKGFDPISLMALIAALVKLFMELWPKG